MAEGKVFIFSAPSGSGKTTIVKHLVANHPLLTFSISATTRQPRQGEENGKDYYFMPVDRFRSLQEKNAFVESEEVYPSVYYGTLKSEVERIWENGQHVVLDVDVIGGLNLKKFFGNKALAVFVKVPDLDTLAKRLKDRNTESPESLKTRLDKAAEELKSEPGFDVSLINDVLERAQGEAKALVNDFIQGELLK